MYARTRIEYGAKARVSNRFGYMRFPVTPEKQPFFRNTIRVKATCL